MTVSATTPVKRYAYSGAGEYSFSFRIFANTDLYVYILDSAGVSTVLSLGSDYTVSISTVTDGGSITTTSPTASGGTLVMERTLDYTQETSWDNQGPLDMTLLESSFDKMTMLLQQMQTTVEGVTVASNWRGDWATGTDYRVRDIVRDTATGNWYQCTVEHTAGTFSTDLSANYWIVVIDFETIETEISAMTGFALTADVVATVVAGENITVDSADPNNPVVAAPRKTPPTGVLVVENINGLAVVYKDASTVTVEKGSCWDSLDTTWLELLADQDVDFTSADAGWYHLFLCDDGVVRKDTDEDGANLSSYKIRYIRSWYVMSTGSLIRGVYYGDVFLPNLDDALVDFAISTNPSTTAFTPDLSSFPVRADRRFGLWGKSTTSNSFKVYVVTADGTESLMLIVMNNSMASNGPGTDYVPVNDGVDKIAGVATSNTGIIFVAQITFRR